MRSSVLIIFVACFLAIAVGLNSDSVNFSLSYFQHRHLQMICLLTCGNNFENKKFVKQATKLLFKVSVVRSDDSLDTREKTESCLRQNSSTIGVLLETTCPHSIDILYYASQNSFMDSTRKWLILDGKSFKYENNTSGILSIFSELNISVDADITLAKKGDQQYTLYELYNFGRVQGGALVITNTTTWSLETGFSNNKLNHYKYYRRWNFQAWPIRMISVVSPAPKALDPKMLSDRMPTKGVATITKTSFNILSVISEIHNFRFKHSIADRWVGDFSVNESKAVVASALYHKKQDISPIVRFMKEVNDKIDLAHPPLTSIETRYYYLIPTYGAGKFENQFLRPLSSGAWLSTLVVSVLCALVLLLSARLESRPSSGQYAVFSVIASVCQQFFDENNIGIERVSAARKVTILVTGISCVLIYNYYTSSVVSWLLNGPPPSINSLQELLDSPLELIFEDVGYTHSWLQTPNYYYNRRNADMEDQLRKKKVFNKKKDASLLKSVEEGIKMVKSGGFAYHTEVDTANTLISRTFTQSELCELGSLQSMEKTPLYPCLQKNSPYKEFFVWSLIRVLERGIVRCVQQRTVSSIVKCEGSSPRALALGGAAPAFLLLAGGYVLATATMLAERLIWRYKENSHRVNKKKISRVIQHPFD